MQNPAEATESVWQGDWELNYGTESSLVWAPGNRGCPTSFIPKSGSLRLAASLLRNRLDHVPDFKGGAGNRGANRGLIIHVGDFDHADGRSHLANHFAGRRILDLMSHAQDIEFVPHFYSVLGADIEYNLPAVDCRHQAFDHDRAGRRAWCCRQ